MRLRHVVLGLAVGLPGMHSAARAILIETSTRTQFGGYLVRDDGKRLEVRVVLPGGKESRRFYERSKITILHEINRGRLEKLAKEDPKAYRDYAEELANQKGDPEARDTARRLYLIAAYLRPQQFGHGALLSMSSLAGTPAEARKCRAMAFLLDPKGDANTLKRAEVKAAPTAKGQTGALQDFQTAMRSFLTRQIPTAKEVAMHKGVDEVFDMAPGMMDRTAFLQRCSDAACATCKSKGRVQCADCSGRGATVNRDHCTRCNGKGRVECTACNGTGVNQSVIDDAMPAVLRAELWAIDQLSGGNAANTEGAGETKWSSILQAGKVRPVPPLSLELITEFDPRMCLYRNGVWVTP